MSVCQDNCEGGICNLLHSLHQAFAKYLPIDEEEEIIVKRDKWGGRLCKCGKARPCFNEPGETIPICCSQCKTATMVNVKHAKCQCGKAQPIYNEPGETIPICCSQCKTATMVDVKNAKCKCGKAQPIYNEPGETKAICCSQCKTATMVNVKDAKCKCGKAIPCYNEPGETKAICCSQCKTATMVDVKNAKCKCGKAIPCYNEPGETIPICCSQCKTATMVDVKNKRCNTHLCETFVNNRYKGYCYGCFIHIFPDSPIVRNHKTKERSVADYIREQFPEYTITFDKSIQGGCSLKRPDIFMDFGEYVLVIEIDENSHQSYDCSCENRRLMTLFQDAGNRPLAMIRFNPDKYYDIQGKSIASCWDYTKDKGLCVVKDNKKKEWQQRLQTLHNSIQLQMTYTGERKEVDVIHLFYDENL